MELFCPGLPKTGCASLRAALIRLGYRVHRHELESTLQPCSVPEPPKGYNVIMGSSYAIHASGIIQGYDCKVILTMRNSNTWRWSVEKQLQDIANVNTHQLVAKYERFNEYVVMLCKAYNRPLLQLDVCRGEGWAELCEFLDKPVPKGMAFPHARSNFTLPPIGVL